MLTRSLHDKLRDSSRPDSAKLNDIASEMLKLDLPAQASDASRRASKDLDDFRKGVERAAESVIGDDTEALRQAEQELADLTHELDREMSEAQRGTNSVDGGSRERAEQGTSSEERGAFEVGENGEGNQSLNQTNRGRMMRRYDLSSTNENGEVTESTAQAGSGDRRRSGQRARNQSSQQQGEGNENEQASNSSEQARTGSREQSSRENAEAQAGQPGQQGSRGGEQASNDSENQANTAQDASARRGDDQSRRGGQELGGARRANRLSDGPRSSTSAGGGEGGGANRVAGWDWGDLIGEDRLGQAGPLTGDEFLSWSDRLRDVEEMIDEADLRNEVAAARERARVIRQEYKREMRKPDWAVVRLQVMTPLNEVRQKLLDELARRDATDSMVPIDRDPVSSRYSELVRRYYEELGKARQ
jgi:hypothetical protein